MAVEFRVSHFLLSFMAASLLNSKVSTGTSSKKYGGRK